MGPGPAPAALHAAFPSPYISALIRAKARQISCKPGFSRSDEPDVAQELILRLLQKLDHYDPSRGASRDTFSDRVIRNEVAMILRDRRRLKRAAGFGAISLDQPCQRSNELVTPLRNMISQADQDRRAGDSPYPPDLELLIAINRALNSLPPAIRTIATRLRHRTIHGTARELGISRQQIHAVIKKIRKRFEEAGLGND